MLVYITRQLSATISTVICYVLSEDNKATRFDVCVDKVQSAGFFPQDFWLCYFFLSSPGNAACWLRGLRYGVERTSVITFQCFGTGLGDSCALVVGHSLSPITSVHPYIGKLRQAMEAL